MISKLPVAYVGFIPNINTMLNISFHVNHVTKHSYRKERNDKTTVNFIPCTDKQSRNASFHRGSMRKRYTLIFL